MPDKNPVNYKTEDQLKAEILAVHQAEAEAAKLHPKTESRLKHENFWYHYKVHVIVGMFLLIVSVFFIKDLLFRTIPDATIILVSSEYLPDESIDSLAAELEGIADDFNGDKKVSILIDRIVVSNNEQQDYASVMKLSTVLAAGNDPIYLMDDESYRHISSMGEDVFIPESVPAGKLLPELTGMRFYLRVASGKNTEYYAYCADLLTAIPD